MLRTTLLASAVLVTAGSAALAGPQYVDETGFAVSGYDPVAFFELDQAPVGEPQAHAVPGRADITADWNGATWAFASEANRDRFLADPEAYAPAYDGHCAYGVAQGGKVPGNPNLWRIVDGTLYLNINPPVVGFWEADIDGNLKASEANWADLEDAAASTKSWLTLDANAGTYETLAPLGG
jgi:YHS domain-containing protein